MRLFLIIALMLTKIAVFAQDQIAKEVARRAMPSVVLLVMEDKNGQPLKMGSGWVIKEGIIVTNFHVISGASGGYIKVVGDKKKLNIEGIVAEDAVHDIALLSIKDLSAQPLTLSENPKQDIGETVFAIGNPKGLEGTFSQGIISGLRDIENDKLLQITAPISPGSSGGPVLNSKSEVIGVSVATLVGGQNLNFAIPVSFAKEALLKLKPVVPLDASTKEKKTYIDSIGSRSTEGVVGSQVVWKYVGWVGGEFTFSLKNNLREAITNIRCLVIFYDLNNEPIDFAVVTSKEIIPGGLAKRLGGKVDEGTNKLTSTINAQSPRTKVEFRILTFDIVEENADSEQ